MCLCVVRSHMAINGGLNTTVRQRVRILAPLPISCVISSKQTFSESSHLKNRSDNNFMRHRGNLKFKQKDICKALSTDWACWEYTETSILIGS